MTTEDLLPLPEVVWITLPDRIRQDQGVLVNEIMKAFEQALEDARAPLLAALSEKEAKFKELNALYEQARSDSIDDERAREKAERERDDLRAQLEAAQKEADEASANFYCERCGCSYCLEAEARRDEARAEKPE